MKRIAVLLLTLQTLACASSGGELNRMPESDTESTAPGAAFSGDMSIRKDMPNRKDPKPWEFYFKHCSTNGQEPYYSKTSYDCSGPYY